MRFTLITVGRVKSPQVAALCDEYAKRMRSYAKLAIVEVRDARDADPDRARTRNAEAMLAAIPKNAKRIALDERGELVTSTGFAERLQEGALHRVGAWAFCIGGADGHTEGFRRDADWVFSLSPMTLPHDLARLVMLEQLYRAMTIIRGEPYHRR